MIYWKWNCLCGLYCWDELRQLVYLLVFFPVTYRSYTKREPLFFLKEYMLEGSYRIDQPKCYVINKTNKTNEFKGTTLATIMTLFKILEGIFVHLQMIREWIGWNLITITTQKWVQQSWILELFQELLKIYNQLPIKDIFSINFYVLIL